MKLLKKSKKRPERESKPSLSKTIGAQFENYDFNLIGAIILLVGFGLVMLYSTTAHMASMTDGGDMFYLKKQAIFSGVSIVGAIMISFLDYHILWTFARLIYAAALILMALVKSPLGATINGARRWIRIGSSLTFQPAEVAKIAVIVMIPVMIIRLGDRFNTLRGCLIPIAAGALQAVAAYILTDNLSTGIIIMIIAFAIVFIAHPKTAPFLALVGACAAVVVVLVILIATEVLNTGFRSGRILAWLYPERYASTISYQSMQALYAIGSGGFIGKGLGNSVQKLGSVPEAQNDMIFSIICEELGIFGGLIVIILFLILLYRLFCIAQNAPDLYGYLMVSGVFVHVAAQVILNLAVVLNVIPTTGITLPFLSYGGTSVALLMAEIAIALSVSLRIREQDLRRNIWGDVE